MTVPAGVSGRSYLFSITPPVGQAKSVSFSQQATSTPKANLTSSGVISPNTQTTVTLNNTLLGNTVPEIVQVYSLSNPDFVYNITSVTNSSTLLNFNLNLNSGKYGFRMFDDLYGWYSFTDGTFLSVSKSSTPYTISKTLTSFNGGLLTVTGDNIGEGATITINGLKGKVISKTPTEALFALPQLVTPITQTAFKLAKNKTISLNDKVKWGDTVGW